MIREFHQISLRGRNSFGVDQRAARLVEFETAEDLRTFFAAGIPGRWTVLAGGNNILFTEDYDGVLLTPVARQIALLSDDGDEVRLRVEAGVEWDDLVEWAVERGLWGIENLSLIPGKAGSAPVQNIGAYGCEAKDAIRRVEMYCVETGNLLTLDAAHCGFGYRESVFKHDLKGRVIITAIEIRLSHTPRPKLGYGDVEREVEARGGATLRNIREVICSIRRAKLPDPAVLGNAGSFFKNPVVEAPVAKRLLAEYPDMPHYAAPEGRVKLAAGWLIDRAGTLKLKAFTQTIDRFDENQGLQETGIGVYFKEDFDNLRDLRQRIKERFTNKKRKARRIARRTARAAEKAAEDADRSRLREPADTLSPFGYVKEEEDE